MNFIIILPEYKIVKIEGNHHVTEYIQESYSKDMISYCNEGDLDYDELTAKNVEDMATIIGGTDDVCKIYELDEVYRVLNEVMTNQEDKEQIISFFNSLELEKAIKCPGDISDLLSEVQELYADELLD